MGTKTYNNYEDLITFTRASKGYALRPVSYGDELVTNGTFESDATGYTLTNCTLVTDSSDPYEGSNSGLFTSTGATGRAIQNFTTVVGRIYRLTAFGKYNSGDTGSIEILGEVENNSQTQITSSDTDWKLIQYSFVATATQHQLRLRERGANDNASFFVDNVSIKEVTFDESNGTLTLFEHPNNVPRVEYDGSNNRLGLLIEEETTNIFPDSSPDTTGNWSGANATATANTTDVLSPERLNNASALIPTTANTSTHNIGYLGIDYTGDHVFSFYYKAPSTFLTDGSKTVDHLRFSAQGTDGTAVYVSMVTNAVTYEASGMSAEVVSIGNGWYRLIVKYNVDGTPAGTLYAHRIQPAVGANPTMSAAYQGDGSTPAVYIYGVQLQAGTFSSSFIKTTGSTVTRAADKATLDLVDFGYNHKTGTVLVEFDAKYESGGSGFPRVYEFSSGTDPGNRVLSSFNEAGNTLSSAVAIGGTGQASLTLKTGLSGSASGKISFAFAEDDFASSDDGDTAVTDTSGTFEPDDNKRTLLAFGASVSGVSNNMTGHIKSFKYYPRRLTNAQLKDLTS